MKREMLSPHGASINSSSYVDGGTAQSDIISYMEQVYSRYLPFNQSFWMEADIDSRMVAGDQSIWHTLYGGALPLSTRNFYFNRIRRVTNMIGGYQRKHRKQIIGMPVEESDTTDASQWTAILSNITRINDSYEHISSAFEGAITTGLNLLHVWKDTTHDIISGDLMLTNMGYGSFMIDPYFRNQDLSDCKYLWTRRLYTREQVKHMLPGREKDIDNLPNGYRDMRFNYLPNSQDFMKSDRLSYDEFYYQDQRKAKFLVDGITGECLEYNGSDEDLERYLNAYPQVVVNESYIPTIKLAIVVNGKVFYDGANLLNIDRYPFVPVLGYFNPDLTDYSRRIQGVVRDLRDSQYLYNRRRVIELDILESQVNSGYMYKPDALVDPDDIFQSGQGKGVAIKEEYEIGRDIQKIAPADIPPSMLQLSELLANEVTQISGVNEELLGSADDDKAGILSALRQGAGLTTLQKLYDQLDNSQKHLGRIFMEAAQKNYTDGKLQRIVGKKPLSPDIKSRILNRYDVAIAAGVMTETQQKLEFVQVFEMIKMGVPIPPERLLKCATIQNKEEIIEEVQQNQQQQAQAAQQKMQAEMALLQAQIRNINAGAEAQHGLGIERQIRAQSDSMLALERQAQAVENIQSARLDKARTLTELAELDLNTIKKALEIADILKRQEETVNPAEELSKMPELQQPESSENIEVDAVVAEPMQEPQGSLLE